jgi:hypothetical protein
MKEFKIGQKVWVEGKFVRFDVSLGYLVRFNTGYVMRFPENHIEAATREPEAVESRDEWWGVTNNKYIYKVKRNDNHSFFEIISDTLKYCVCPAYCFILPPDDPVLGCKVSEYDEVRYGTGKYRKADNSGWEWFDITDRTWNNSFSGGVSESSDILYRHRRQPKPEEKPAGPVLQELRKINENIDAIRIALVQSINANGRIMVKGDLC